MSSRKYPQKDVKLLYGLAAARCAFESCRRVCAAPETSEDDAVVLGRIAHIYAHSEEGPRANPEMSLEERDSYSNWVLLCADCHDIIDKQEHSYSADCLLGIKRDHEAWVADQLQEAVPSVSFAELEMATSAVLAAPVDPTSNFTLIRPEEKIKKNGLSKKIGQRITIGLMKAREVEDFVRDMAKRIPNFPEQLSQGFIVTYQELRADGVSGDLLFEELHSFASAGSNDFDKRSAALTVLVYLFEKCEVFER